jgi:hypothetical protein
MVWNLGAGLDVLLHVLWVFFSFFFFSFFAGAWMGI